jgi:hypothetical protein
MSSSSPPAFRAKPGMSRDDLLKTNSDIVGQVTEQGAKYSPNSIHHRRLESARRNDAGRVSQVGISERTA